MAVSKPHRSGGDPFAMDPSVQAMSASRSWREPLTGFEWLALRSAPVYYGFGAPRGHGEPVVLLPGFMGNDMYLAELFFWRKLEPSTYGAPARGHGARACGAP